MAFTIDGTNGLTFPDSSNQTTRAVSRSGDTMSGNLSVTTSSQLLNNLTNGQITLCSPNHTSGWGVNSAIAARTGDSIWAMGSNGTTGTANATVFLGVGSITSSTFVSALQYTQAGIVTKAAQPSFMVRRSSVTGVVDPVIWDQVIHNTGNHYNSSTGRFTAPVSGRYLFNLYAMPSGTAYTFYANYGSTVHYLNTVSSGQTGCMSVIVNLSANDTCSVRVAGGSINSSNNDNNAWSGFLLG